MKKQGKGWLIAVAILLVAALAVNIACASLNTMITSFMGANLNPMITGSKAQESAEILSVADATEQSLRMAEELESEGIVLLRNENAALPLASGTKVNLFGYASIDPIYGGTGSGSGDTSSNVDVVKGLTNAGLVVNEELVKFYQNSGISRPKQGGYTGSNFTPAEVPVSSYTDAVLAQAKEFSDTAIIVLSRIGGEGGDLPQDMFAAGYSQTDDGRHYLELTQDEADLLALVKSQGYARIIVMINSSNAMELGFVEDGIDACIWVGSPGAVGFNAVGSALTGAVNPSGRLTDTYAYDLSTAPAYWNAGSFTYGNLSRNYVEYAEGIYVGYRYYETAAQDGFIDYAKTVQYPFGYGLSYTTFEQAIDSYSDGNGTIAVLVKVTNTGNAAGKDVVQVYYTAPYTKGGIEKAHVVLAGFGKTKLLEPGESETVTIAFKAEDMASFDSFGAGCYVLEAGDYEIKIMNNAHDVIDSRVYTVKDTVVYGEGNPRSTDKTAAVAHFADVQNGQITVYTSRSDWEGTTPKAREDGKTASDAVVKAFSEKAPYEVNDSDPAIVYADNGLVLEDMAGLDWDDPKWELLLQQLSDEDMATMILNGGWSTPAVDSVGKPATSDLDGPAGINSLVSSLRGVSFPSEVVIGSTWNEKLVEEFGRVFAQEAAANGVVGLYAPGMNIHRTPFSGRNFEYYSEDGFLSGKLGAAQVKGSESQGVYMYAKHFALNDQESNRLSISVWANEQAIREIYLKPFELTVKEGKTTAIMSSYSHLGTTWAGASKALITDVLRGEWGFVGMVVTDSAMANTSWMDPNLAVRAGNDMMLCLMGASIDSSNNTARNAMRTACHNILYTQANSMAVQVEADNTPYWYGLVALFNAIILSAILLIILKKTAFKDKKLGWVGIVTVLAVFALSALLVWFAAIKPATVKKTSSAAQTETAEAPAEEAATSEAKENEPAKAETPAAPAVSPENGMELYDLADFWLGCHVYINADGTYRVAYDYNEENKDIEGDAGTWARVSDTELTLTSNGGSTIPVTLADNKWSCEVKESNTGTVCHPYVEVDTAPAAAASVSPETGMELYDLADFWLGCHVYINADGTYRVAYDYNEENKDIEGDAGTWARVSDNELTLTSNSGAEIPVTLADGKWSCEVRESNTGTICHPSVEITIAEAAAVSPEAGMELYDLADYWLGCHVYINADGTYRVAYDYNEENQDIEGDAGTWSRVSDTELALTSNSGATIPVTLADGKWSCEVKEANTGTVCHPYVEAGAAPTAPAVSPEAGMELYDLADFWLGCHVYINADGTFRVAYDFNEENKDIEYDAGTWTRVSDTELALASNSGATIPVTLADGKWSCEVTEPNTGTVCHPSIEAGAPAAAAVSPEDGMELYDLADFWLGCHVYVNADGTFRVTYDYNEENKDIEYDAGTWTRVSDTEFTLNSNSGAAIPVTLADGKWSCEITEPNTGTVCHPSIESGEETAAAAAAEPEKVTYMVVFTEPDGSTVYNAIETTDASVIPETAVPEKEGYMFAGWQSKPDVTKEELVLGVSPYEVTLGASSLYGGAGVSITDYELMGNMLLLYPRWVEATEIHTIEDLKAMKDDLMGWYVLAEDIDLAGENWEPVGMYFSNYETVNAPYWTYAFRGTFDGAGHTIRNLTITMDSCEPRLEGFENAKVWRNDGTALGGDVAFFGTTAKANIHDVTFENPVINVTSQNDATPYVAVVNGFDLASTMKNVIVNDAIITVNTGDADMANSSLGYAWTAASAFTAGGWSTIIEDCEVKDAAVNVNGTLVKTHGGEFYIGAMLGEGYAFMDHDKATGTVTVALQDECESETDKDLIVNIGGMGGTNTNQIHGTYDTKISVSVKKPTGKSEVSVGGLTGSQRYSVAEENMINAEITTDCSLDPENGKLYVGKVIGSTNVPYCIVQMIFSEANSVDYSGCRNNEGIVTLNGEEIQNGKGQQLSVNGEPLAYIANGDIESDGVIYTSNINDVIAEYGSAVPSSFLQKCVIVLLDD